MLRLIIIMVLSIYLLNKLGGFLFKLMDRQPVPPNFKRPDGNINVDPNPKKKGKGGIQGGEYVDYEEVK